jgi:hypothetical protein
MTDFCGGGGPQRISLSREVKRITIQVSKSANQTGGFPEESPPKTNKEETAKDGWGESGSGMNEESHSRSCPCDYSLVFYAGNSIHIQHM